MWYPPPVLVPIYLEPNPGGSVAAPVAAMWPVIPFEQHMYLAVNDMAGEFSCSQIKSKYYHSGLEVNKYQ